MRSALADWIRARPAIGWVLAGLAGAGAVIGERLEGEFHLSYGTVLVLATWLCGAGADSQG